jgi:hypothetical protein
MAFRRSPKISATGLWGHRVGSSLPTAKFSDGLMNITEDIQGNVLPLTEFMNIGPEDIPHARIQTTPQYGARKEIVWSLPLFS